AIQARELHSAFYSFGTAISEKSLRQAAGRNVGDLLGEIRNWLCMIDVRGAMDQLVHLRLSGGDDLRIVMPSIDDGDAREAVKIFTAVLVGHDSTTRFIDHDRHNRLHKAGHYIIFVFLNRIGHEFLSAPLCSLW